MSSLNIRSAIARLLSNFAVDRRGSRVDMAKARILASVARLAQLLLGAGVSKRTAVAVEEYKRGNYEIAFRLFLSLAERGNAYAQFHVGAMYTEGHGVPQDDARARNWYRKAANQGHLDAQFMFCLMAK